MSNRESTTTRIENKRPDLAGFSAWVIGIFGAGFWLAFWQWLVGAAQWFSPAMALLACLCFIGYSYVNLDEIKQSLRVTGSILVGLALAAGLSLGAFLPYGVADAISPALGRFGGAGGLLVLAFLGAAYRKAGFSLFCFLGAIWVALNTASQASFPPAPTTGDQWAGLLTLPVLAGLITLILGIISKFVTALNRIAPAFLRWAIACGLLAALPGIFFGQTIPAVGGVVVALLGLLFPAWAYRNRRITIILKQVGLVLLLTLGITTLYISTGEQLETVLLRNTLERTAQKGWWWLFGDDRFPEQRGLKVIVPSPGSVSGQVSEKDGKPLAGANIVLADPAGKVFQAVSDANGRYTVDGVPPGHYLPMAARAGYLDAPAMGNGPLGRWRQVASVRSGQTTNNIDFVMQAREVYKIQPGISLTFGNPEEVFRDNPVPSPAQRRSFSFTNDGLDKAGLVYEPPTDRGSGPFPILLIVYPGPANAWEGVSIPLAAQGFIVIAYQPELFGPHPERGLNLKGEVSDMLQLYNYAKSGRFSSRGDPQSIIVTGGSVSTAYTYLLLRELENSVPAEKAALKGGIKYGGLADMYRYHYDWDRGALYIDPGIQDLETMLVAFGRPDLRPESYLTFSPIYHLGSGSLPPLLLVHTSKDTIVPVIQTEEMAAVMERLGIQRKLLIYTDIEHYLDTSKRDPAQLDMLNKTIDFMKEVTARP